MPLTEVAFRAAVAAISTVLPISESAHRVVVAMWLGAADDARLLWAAALLGCALALTGALRERAGACGRALVSLVRGRPRALGSDGGRDLIVVLVAAGLSLVLGWALGARNVADEREPLLVGVGLAATVVTLLSTAAAPSPRRLRPGMAGAALVGLAHGLGIVPGASQVGAAYVALCWLGVRGWRAAELALLVTVTTTVVTALTDLLGSAAPSSWGTGSFAVALATGALAAALAAYGWRWLADRERSRVFVAWLAPLALAVLAYAHALSP